MTTSQFPLPVPNLDNQEFWDKCREHRLVLRRCRDCHIFKSSSQAQLPRVCLGQPGMGGIRGQG